MCRICKCAVESDKWKRHESSPGHKRRLLLLKEAKKKKQQQQLEAERRARENPPPEPVVDRETQVKAQREAKYKELQPYLVEGTHLLRKQRLCIVKKVDWTLNPPSITVKMVDSGVMISTELEYLDKAPNTEKPKKEEPKKEEEAEEESSDDRLGGLPEDFFDTQFRVAQHERLQKKKERRQEGKAPELPSKQEKDESNQQEEVTRDDVVEDSGLPKRKKYGKRKRKFANNPNRKRVKATYAERTLNVEEATTAKGAQLKVPVKQKESEFAKEISALTQDVAKERKKQRKSERAAQLELQKQLRKADRLEKNFEKKNIVDLRKLAEEAKEKARKKKAKRAKEPLNVSVGGKMNTATNEPVDDFDIDMDGLVDWKQKSWF